MSSSVGFLTPPQLDNVEQGQAHSSRLSLLTIVTLFQVLLVSLLLLASEAEAGSGRVVQDAVVLS